MTRPTQASEQPRRLSQPAHPRWWNSRRGVVSVGLALAAVTIAGAFPTWVVGEVVDPVLGRLSVSANGQQLAPAVVAGGVAAFAGILAAIIGGRALRVICAAAVLAAGVLGMLATGTILRAPVPALATSASGALGPGSVAARTATVNLWPWVSLLCCFGLALVAIALVVFGPRWGQAGQRFEPDSTPAGTPAATGSQPVASDWDRLSQGQDPTVSGAEAERDDAR